MGWAEVCESDRACPVASKGGWGALSMPIPTVRLPWAFSPVILLAVLRCGAAGVVQRAVWRLREVRAMPEVSKLL